jgi:beta-glucanase (GH16 family)
VTAGTASDLTPEYGQCGVGAYCLGGCDPKYSNSLDSCVPAPVCESKDYSFSNLDGIIPNTKYLGDASKADWVSSGAPLPYDGKLLLTMQEGSVGTLLASTHYVWYGKVSAKLKTSAGKGVVTAFILLSDVKDEVDFEFVGIELESAQSNFYSQGVTNCMYPTVFGTSCVLTAGLPDNNGANHTGLPNTLTTEHEYEIDWTPDQITWSIDGKEVRTQKKSDTWNATSNRFDYPQTPARVQLSLWPAGLPSNGEGTINWGGGLVDWSSQYMTNGYYYAAFSEVKMECYDPPSGANVKGTVSYTYDDVAGTNDSVVIGNKPTVLKSLLGTGTNMSAEYPSASSSASDSAETSDVATVPGLTGAGPGTNGQRGDNQSGGSGSNSGSGGSSGTQNPSSAPTGFVQGGGSNGSGNGGTIQRPEKILQGSLFAVVVAVIGVLAM